jgi:hypothetical protein
VWIESAEELKPALQLRSLKGRRFDAAVNGHCAREHEILPAFEGCLIESDEQKSQIVQPALSSKPHTRIWQSERTTSVIVMP